MIMNKGANLYFTQKYFLIYRSNRSISHKKSRIRHFKDYEESEICPLSLFFRLILIA